jgi:response regulator of citrate/malate metabolism
MKKQIIKLLKESPQGLSINKISQELNITKLAALRYLELLLKQKKIIIEKKQQNINLTIYKVKQKKDKKNEGIRKTNIH